MELNGVDFGLFQGVAESGEMPTGVGYTVLMRALAFIVYRRRDETYTWEQTAKMSLNQISDLLEEVGDLDPTVPLEV